MYLETVKWCFVHLQSILKIFSAYLKYFIDVLYIYWVL